MKIFIFTVLLLVSCNSISQNKSETKKKKEKEVILKIEMELSAFGVESDNFPSIRAYIDFEKKTSNCKKWFYNPAYKGGTYSLTESEINTVFELLKTSDLEKLKKEYTVNYTDQPTSTTTIYTSQNKFVIKDYGMLGEFPLQELYKIVYKFN